MLTESCSNGLAACGCGVIVQAGRDVFVVSHCYGDHITAFLQYEDGILEAKRRSSNRYNVIQLLCETCALYFSLSMYQVIVRCVYSFTYLFQWFHHNYLLYMYTHRRLLLEYNSLWYVFSSQQIYLPHGSMVDVVYARGPHWSTMNINIFPSPNDMDKLEGLCGTFNGNYRDDLLDSYGTITPVDSSRWTSYPDNFSASWG